MYNHNQQRFLVVLLALLAPTAVVAEEPHSATVVALDHHTGDLLRACFPAVEFQVLVRREDEPNSVVNRRAWSTRDADVLVYRSDQISIRSQLFRERLMTQGIRVVDLNAHISVNRALQFRLDTVGPNLWRLDSEQLIAMHPPATSQRVDKSATCQTISVLQNHDPCFQDDELQSVRCQPLGVGTESQQGVVANVCRGQGNE
ncbi:MAG: hypothetical protein CMM01_13365 [Rhodopirellula sp.]|nr:hypothetical protein [Rhodopirellula sp.]OUX50758.1 MAG: hypothetical protein CBE43_05825 [Rhodopirellula sp. TMED283]